MIPMVYAWNLLKEKKEISIPWTFGGVTPEVAIKGFGGATLFSTQPNKTAEVLENFLGLKPLTQKEDSDPFPFLWRHWKCYRPKSNSNEKRTNRCRDRSPHRLESH